MYTPYKSPFRERGLVVVLKLVVSMMHYVRAAVVKKAFYIINPRRACAARVTVVVP